MTYSGLQLDQTAPFTAQERARIGLRDDDEAGIILPVPPSAGRLSFKHEGRDPDHCYTYRDATGGVLGDIFRCNAYNGCGKHFQPATFWKGANGKGAWQHKSWPSPRPLFGLNILAKHPEPIVVLVEGEKAPRQSRSNAGTNTILPILRIDMPRNMPGGQRCNTKTRSRTTGVRVMSTR